MKRTLTLLLLFAIFSIPAISQINSVGHRVVTFNDPLRTGGFGSGGGAGRQIQTEIYYPSTAATDGDSTAMTSGQYPILIFGHGFVMVWSAYDNIWKDLVLQSYIICFPRTEGGTSPSHTEFGKDLALLQSKMLGLNGTSSSPFFNSMTNKVAIMGHSMGGGSAFLACAGNTAPTTLVTFAAANTNPSSISAAQLVSIPTLVIAGQNDCVAPPAQHQDSMYIKCAAACKAEVTIKGAAHCEFANYNFNCTFGQSTCSPQPTITAAQQKTIASVYYSYWLNYWLKNDCPSWNSCLDSINLSTNIIKQISCGVSCSSGINDNSSFSHLKIAPNPTQGLVNFTFDKEQEHLSVEIYDAIYRKLESLTFENSKEITINLESKEKGIYFIVIKDSGNSRAIKIIKD